MTEPNSEHQNPPSGSNTHDIGGVPFMAASPREAVRLVLDRAMSGLTHGVHVHLANAYSIALASDSSELRTVFGANNAINFPDGKPVSWFSRKFGHDPHLTQVRGPQFFVDVLDASSGSGMSHYFIGGRPEVLESLLAQIRTKQPAVLIAGAESPPFRPLTAAERDDQIERVRASGASIIWLGLGTPKQDFEADRLAKELRAVVIAIGAAFDYAAGTLREAPPLIQRMSLEWLFRFAMEPRRLWHRYTIGNAKFIIAALRGRPR